MYEALLYNISGSTVRTAISFYGKKYSFDKVFRLIDILADNLAAAFSVGKGDTVTLCMPNSPAALLCFYAANKLGAAVNLVHPFIPPEALRESVRRTGSKLVLVYDVYRCGEADFGVPALVSDSAHYMGGPAKLYYRCTQKRAAFGESFEKYLKDPLETGYWFYTDENGIQSYAEQSYEFLREVCALEPGTLLYIGGVIDYHF